MKFWKTESVCAIASWSAARAFWKAKAAAAASSALRVFRARISWRCAGWSHHACPSRRCAAEAGCGWRSGVGGATHGSGRGAVENTPVFFQLLKGQYFDAWNFCPQCSHGCLPSPLSRGCTPVPTSSSAEWKRNGAGSSGASPPRCRSNSSVVSDPSPGPKSQSFGSSCGAGGASGPAAAMVYGWRRDPWTPLETRGALREKKRSTRKTYNEAVDQPG